MSTVEDILAEFEEQTEAITLVPSGNGVFEVTVDGNLVFSKKAIDRHAEEGEVVRLIKER